MPPLPRRVVAVAVGLLVPFVSLAAQQVVRLVPADGRVAIWNLVGNVRVEPGSGNEVEVTITRLGSDASQLETRTGLIGGMQTLRIFHPGDAIRAADAGHLGRRYTTTLRLRDDGRFDAPNNTGRRVRISNDGGAEASADLVVHVPSGVALDLHVGLGDIGARGSASSLAIETGAGTVRTTETRGPLHIETGSGSVAVARHFGNLDIDTGSGAVDASDIEGGATVSIETGSGSLNVVRCRATDRLRLDTGSGRIVALRIEAATMSLDTGSGSVEVAPNGTAGDLHVETGSGSVTLLAPADFSAELSASAGSGGVQSDLPIEVIRRERGELRGRIGDGRSRVTLETGSGGITLRPASRRSTI